MTGHLDRGSGTARPARPNSQGVAYSYLPTRSVPASVTHAFIAVRFDLSTHKR